MCFQSWAVVSVAPGVCSQHSVVFVHFDISIDSWDLLTPLEYNPISISNLAKLLHSPALVQAWGHLIIESNPAVHVVKTDPCSCCLLCCCCFRRQRCHGRDWGVRREAQDQFSPGSMRCSGSCCIPEGRGSCLNSSLGLVTAASLRGETPTEHPQHRGGFSFPELDVS